MSCSSAELIQHVALLQLLFGLLSSFPQFSRLRCGSQSTRGDLRKFRLPRVLHAVEDGHKTAGLAGQCSVPAHARAEIVLQRVQLLVA